MPLLEKDSTQASNIKIIFLKYNLPQSYKSK